MRNFYIFIENDADYVTNYMVLRKTVFSKDYMKCGFPKSSLDSYLKIFMTFYYTIYIYKCYYKN